MDWIWQSSQSTKDILQLQPYNSTIVAPFVALFSLFRCQWFCKFALCTWVLLGIMATVLCPGSVHSGVCQSIRNCFFPKLLSLTLTVYYSFLSTSPSLSIQAYWLPWLPPLMWLLGCLLWLCSYMEPVFIQCICVMCCLVVFLLLPFHSL